MFSSRILLIEDDQRVCDAICRMLAQALTLRSLRTVRTVAEAAAVLLRDEVDLVIVDARLPDGTAIDVLKLAGGPFDGSVPTLLLADQADHSIVATALMMGAYHFVFKDVEQVYLQLLPTLVRSTQMRHHTQSVINQLATFPDQNPNPVIELTRSGEMTFVNRAAREQIPRISALGSRHELLRDLLSLLDRREQGENPVVPEVRAGQRLFQRKIRPVPGTDLVRIFCNDVTEIRRAEAAVRRSERRFRAVFESAPVGIVISNTAGQFLSANRAFQHFVGYSSEALRDMTFLDLTHPDDQDLSSRSFRNILVEGADHAWQETRYCRSDGTVAWGQTGLFVIRDDEHNFQQMIAVVEDVTEKKRHLQALSHERERSERLLRNILPAAIAERLKGGGETIADHFEQVTVLFADIVDFTAYSSMLNPYQLVEQLNSIFSTFDHLVSSFGLEKIKTNGDSYMVVGGLPVPQDNHAEKMVALALSMQQAIRKFCLPDGEPFSMRIGIHSGPVVAGVIGRSKFSYDLWGDTVNIASRMESHGVAGQIQVTETVYEQVKDLYTFIPRGPVPVKGMGMMNTYLLKTGLANQSRPAVPILQIIS